MTWLLEKIVKRQEMENPGFEQEEQTNLQTSISQCIFLTWDRYVGLAQMK